ncbi:MAG: transcription-repair coupling factor [Chitinophagales bacterium]|nr:transcription-repair coupling factor [Bacteroidota bacterium]MCB9043274.1 transcription-repair coupling factor [Chitinophagales bacterium]
MDSKEFLAVFRRNPRTQAIVSYLKENDKSRVHLAGTNASHTAILLGSIVPQIQTSALIICEDKETAAYCQNDLSQLLTHKEILFFPDSFKKIGYFDEINKNNVLARTETVSKMLYREHNYEFLVTYPEALFEKIVSPARLKQQSLHIKVGETLELDFMVDMLIDLGFAASDMVYEPGEFATRGGIFDLYSFGNDLPYRIELEGDTVSSIRIFNPATQISERKLSQITIVPNVQTQFQSNEKVSLLEVLPENSIIFIANAEMLAARIDQCFVKLNAARQAYADKEALEENPILREAEDDVCVNAETFLTQLQNFSLCTFGTSSALPQAKVFQFDIKPLPVINKNFDILIENLRHSSAENYQNFILAENPRQIRRLNQIFHDVNAKVSFTHLPIELHEGFIDADEKMAIYTDHQIFNRFHKYKLKTSFSATNALSLRMLKDLQPGDYVVHIDHGVGQYAGLQKLESAGKLREVVRLTYKDGDILYVGINSLHKISKYVGKDGKPPVINKLGSDAWENLKRKAKKKIKEIAFDLIRLYAKRRATKGISFPPDNYIMAELEASFIYEETPDQLKAVEEVKQDLEADFPMDRLVCGDVGFGKTEIAIRAAAKVVCDSKQVAVLVPTTILAMQHYKTFSERMLDLPFRIDFINRFKSSKEKKITLEKVKNGEVDILIGTHALLSNKIAFKDLGLLIIDEEQKFGVAAKEKLKNFKVNIDTLTLTATPIPRTLQFSLMSARDLSIISTPPANRQSVNTQLMVYDAEKIRDAIYYEIDRGGQVFFVHNRVRDIEEIATSLRQLCPDVEIGVAHGQMTNEELEDHMIKFENRYYDVLVSTNIIESGLDIPNANTIVINNAHWFGLSDLHQMRGRVGRSNQKAFCYLITPPLYTLADDARKRLRTIEQYADLGSGFQIAMRDLDIRGAGNLLGAEQSGFIADIGYETYMKILDESIRELKENEFEEVFKDHRRSDTPFVRDCFIDADAEMLIPDDYVKNTAERLSLYTRLDNLKSESDIQKFADELRDRFGPLPRSIHELFYAVRLRILATALGFEQVILKSNKLRCYFVNINLSSYYKSDIFGGIMAFVQTNKKGNLKQTSTQLLWAVDDIYSLKQACKLLEELNNFVFKEKVAPNEV